MNEREVKLGQQLAALFGELGANRLGILETTDLVTTEATVASDRPVAEVKQPFLRTHRRERRPGLFHRHDRAHVIEQHVVDVGRRIGRPGGRARAAGQSGEIRGHVGDLRLGQPQVWHVGLGAVVLRVADPIEQPFVAGLAADALQRLPERPSRPRVFT